MTSSTDGKGRLWPARSGRLKNPRANAYWSICSQCTAREKAINGLVSIIEGEMDSDPFSADLYIFCNRARTLVKMVAWEANGSLPHHRVS